MSFVIERNILWSGAADVIPLQGQPARFPFVEGSLQDEKATDDKTIAWRQIY